MKKGLYLTFDIKVVTGVFVVLLTSLMLVLAVKAERQLSASVMSIHAKPIIIIDAGHGGEDGGTQSADGTLEKDINLAISLKLNKILTRYGFDTVMIRESDKMIYDEESSSTVRGRKSSDLHNRMEIMKHYPGSIFLSIHQNHFSESKYSGAQVFYCKSQADSDTLALKIQESIVKSLQKENTRQIKPCSSDVYLIYNAETTAVMVECGFLSNPAEAEKLTDNTYQYEMALAISKGLTDYLQQKEADYNGNKN